MGYTSQTRIAGLTKIRRQRVLPRPGEILVGVGSRVEATHVVARTNLPSGFRIVAVARLLDVPTSEVGTYLQVKLGDTVQQGDVIARRRGLLGRSVRSPVDGVLTGRGGGRLLIEAQPIPFELHAYVPGRVVHVSEEQGVVIETSGALVQATWGSGGESIGVLKNVADGAREPLRARAIDGSCHGAVLVAGVTRDREALQRAQDVEAHGVVTGGLSPELISFAEQLSFPVVVTEGIGDIPMIGPIFNLLKQNDGREASISGRVTSRRSSTQPEIIIPKLDRRSSPRDETEREGEIRVGTPVRIVRAPRMGTVGKVVGLPRYARRIETGARARCADVDIGQEEPVSIPLVNLDVLG
jgi:hypothetical protein